jgi:hypothetical protein
MVRRLGKTLIVLPVVAALIVVIYAIDAWSWPLTFLTAALVGGIAFLGLVYYARLRASEGFFDRAIDPTVIFTFDDEGVRTESDLGSTDMKWQVFDEILKFPEVWLLVYAKN